MSEPIQSDRETEDAAIWRTCHVITGDCKRCPASEMVDGDECIRGCRMQAEECVNVVETGNPWRKTAQADLRAPWVALWPTGEGVSGGLAELLSDIDAWFTRALPITDEANDYINEDGWTDAEALHARISALRLHAAPPSSGGEG